MCEKELCEFCGQDGEFSIQVVVNKSTGKIHLPNQFVKRNQIKELMLCRDCIHKIEKAINKKIAKIIGCDVVPETLGPAL